MSVRCAPDFFHHPDTWTPLVHLRQHFLRSLATRWATAHLDCPSRPCAGSTGGSTLPNANDLGLCPYRYGHTDNVDKQRCLYKTTTYVDFSTGCTQIFRTYGQADLWVEPPSEQQTASRSESVKQPPCLAATTPPPPLRHDAPCHRRKPNPDHSSSRIANSFKPNDHDEKQPTASTLSPVYSHVRQFTN
jgi:hypothetical protein